MTTEHGRLKESTERGWKKWGPYLSERQWGTVREDCSPDGNSWNSFTHDHARSRAYKWGEDGIAGISDIRQRLCFAVAFWNGVDPILKERMFGLTNSEGNHGEDVKEYYFYLDNTPTHSYMKYLYKYPQKTYPYADLVQTNSRRTRNDFEYELIDTGVFDEDRYFDIFIEYAKADPDDIYIRFTVCNRGPEAATLHLLPTLWFRNIWSNPEEAGRPLLQVLTNVAGVSAVAVSEPVVGEMFFYCDEKVPVLFTENETNNSRLFGTPNFGPYVKDGINDYIVHGNVNKINPAEIGTKCAAHYALPVSGKGQHAICVRLTKKTPSELARKGEHPTNSAARIFTERIAEADEFYTSITPGNLSDEQAMVMRQSLAGMLWTKQFYSLHVAPWLKAQRGVDPMVVVPRHTQNADWYHMVNDDIISVPDKWEYPWYAAWDLAFHAAALSMVDLQFAKEQLELMLKEYYLHPNGQIPAYEQNFSDVNPPVHAWATLFIYTTEAGLTGRPDLDFLKRTFNKLLLNFTWWANRKDPTGRNVFEGGFLGVDNVGVFDRSRPLAAGGCLEQADGIAWMALFSLNMLEIALELATFDPVYEDVACKFLEHFFWIASAMDRIGDHKDEMWDEKDGFFYDLMRLPTGEACRLKIRSMVGLLPLCATTVISESVLKRFPRSVERVKQFLARHPNVILNIASPTRKGQGNRTLFAVVNETKLRRILSRVLDEKEFLSPYGLRSLSLHHRDNPFMLNVGTEEFRVSYLPAESDTSMFGGNLNWRGPVWFPVNALIIRAVLQFYLYYGDDFKIECPTGSGRMMNLFEVARELGNRLTGLFLRDENGRRPVFGGNEKFQTDQNWRDYLLFYEYFHGDNGAGIGANHQTGWTGIVARFIQLFGFLDGQQLLRSDAPRRLTLGFVQPKAARRSA